APNDGHARSPLRLTVRLQSAERDGVPVGDRGDAVQVVLLPRWGQGRGAGGAHERAEHDGILQDEMIALGDLRPYVDRGTCVLRATEGGRGDHVGDVRAEEGCL